MSGEADLTGQVAVVTGATGGLGQVIAAAHHIANRHSAVHILVNNAGAHFTHRRLSDDGIEMHIALDYLAGFGLTTLLNDPLTRGRARIVHVASDTVNDTRQLKLPFGRPRPATVDADQLADLRNLNPKAGFMPFQAYARAKLLTVMAGYEAAQRLAPHGVTVNSLHPGIVATDIIDSLIPAPLTPFAGLLRRTMLTPEQGASAALRLAADSTLTTTGRYFVRATPAATPAISHDTAVRRQLWDISAGHFT